MSLLWKGLTSRVLKGHSSYVFCINYNTEGTQLVSGGCDGDVKIWNAAKGKCVLGKLAQESEPRTWYQDDAPKR
jgi:WD40 repeat protein